MPFFPSPWPEAGNSARTHASKCVVNRHKDDASKLIGSIGERKWCKMTRYASRQVCPGASHRNAVSVEKRIKTDNRRTNHLIPIDRSPGPLDVWLLNYHWCVLANRQCPPIQHMVHAHVRVLDVYILGIDSLNSISIMCPLHRPC